MGRPFKFLHKLIIGVKWSPGERWEVGGVRRPTTRYDGDTPNHPAFTINETWGALKRCWLAYNIAARDDRNRNDDEKALKYAKRIRKLQFELGISIAEFPQLGLFGTEPESVDLSCD